VRAILKHMESERNPRAGQSDTGISNGSDRIDFGFRQVDPADHTSMVRGVFDSVAQRYDLMNDLMSGGLHRLWKTALLDRLAPRAGMSLLDVAGGTGDIAGGFLKRGGGSAVICDINREMLMAGRDRALDRGMVAQGPARICGDAAALPIARASVDTCTIAFGLRNVTRRTQGLAEMHQALKPGGHFICLEFSPAVLPQLKSIYDTYSFKVLPWLGQQVAGDRESYAYLAESIRTFPEPDILASEMRDAGFGNITQTPMTGGIVWMHSGWRV
jgi:demethylmenaquinone methyltransferase / 2-methoxy-6-polyprenyl-1,4-benzoquinol methylase